MKFDLFPETLLAIALLVALAVNTLPV